MIDELVGLTKIFAGPGLWEDYQTVSRVVQNEKSVARPPARAARPSMKPLFWHLGSIPLYPSRKLANLVAQLFGD
ncbi:MAG TPA: hypothetical protein PKB10_13210 [Tepidisphaeraceae bacterium]|nr:hypothetical protein [Tepidisphaeraceae bacterium]